MVARNDITGDAIQSRVSSKAYSDNYENIFRKKDKKNESDSMEQESVSILRSGQEPAQDEGH
jgi:hypothetical protein